MRDIHHCRRRQASAPARAPQLHCQTGEHGPRGCSARFRRGAEAYERSRPSYPPESVAWLVHQLGIRPGAVVADLAAGTGKFTRLLMPTGATRRAIEPVSESP